MRQETEKWLRKAKEDFDTANQALKWKKFDVVTFYSQQAAEKVLKALQIEKLNKYDKVHDLAILAKSVDAPSKIQDSCKRLTPFYIMTRYPESELDVDEDKAKKAIKQSKEVINWVEQKLKS